MNIINKAFDGLNKDISKYSFKINYSRRFSSFNANIKKTGYHIEFNLSSEWRDIGEEIRIGLIQHLAMRMFKIKKNTLYTQLYDEFIKRLDKFTPITHKDDFLEESFNRVNEKYFNGLVDIPNLKFGQFSTTQLGVYNFQTNKITISSILKEFPDIIDYVMYHELLHKKEKYKSKNGRHFYHTKTFRDLERKFENYKLMDEKIKQIIRAHKKPTKKKTFFENLFGY